MNYIPLYIIRDELRNHYLKFGSCINMRMAVETVAKKPENFSSIREYPFPENIEDITDEEFFRSFFHRLYLYTEHNSKDYLYYTAKNIFTNQHLVQCFLHENYADQTMHRHDFFEITYSYRGHCVMRFSEETICIEEGNVCIIPPGIQHEAIVRDDTSFILNLAVTRSAMEAAMASILIRKDAVALYIRNILFSSGTSHYLFIPSANSDMMKKSARHICAESGEAYYSISNRISWMSVFICSFFDQYYLSDADMSMFSQEQRKKFRLMEYIQDNFKNATLDSTAAFFNYNKSYLSRLIKQLTGKTFIEILTDLKLDYGKALLIETHFTFDEIAEQIGYSSGDYFSKIFKKIYHISAADYRKQEKESRS